jgi:hypothetical protein
MNFADKFLELNSIVFQAHQHVMLPQTDYIQNIGSRRMCENCRTKRKFLDPSLLIYSFAIF